MRVQYRKGRPARDYRGAQVSMDWQGKTLLGDLVGIEYCEFGAPGYRAIVRHFNGEDWPVRPSLSALEILEGRNNG